MGDLGGNGDAAQAFHRLDLTGSDAHHQSHHAGSGNDTNGSSCAKGSTAIVALKGLSSPPGLQGKVDALQHGLSRRYRPDLHQAEEDKNHLAVVPYSPKPAAPSYSNITYGASQSFVGKSSTAGSARSAPQSWQSPTSRKAATSTPVGKASVAPRAAALQAALKGHSAFADPVPSHVVVE